MTRRLALLVLLITTVSSAAACGDDDTPVISTAPPQPEDGLVIRVDRGGGFVTPEIAFTSVPSISVYADGLVLSPGATIQIYPGPALVPLHATDVSQERIGELLDRAEELGLLEDEVDYGEPPIADAPDTVVTIVTDERRVEHRVNALDEADAGLSEDQAEARERLQTFIREVEEGAFEGGESRRYQPDAYRARAVAEEPEVDAASPEPQPRVVDWPAELLAPSQIGSCAVFEADAARAVEALFADADQLTFFRDADGQTWRVTVRPVLPDEAGCPDR